MFLVRSYIVEYHGAFIVESLEFIVEGSEELQELLLPLDALGRSLEGIAAKAMSSSLVLDVTMRNGLGCQCGVEEFAVAIMHHGIILTVNHEERRTLGGTWDMVLQRQAVPKRSAPTPILSQQGPAAPMMDVWFA